MTFYKINSDLKIKKSENFLKKPKKPNLDLANFLNIGYYLLVPLLLGVFLGVLIDRSLKTKYWVVIMIFLGFAASIYNLYSLTKKSENNKYGRN